jgi:CheY-like chemotaxis protein
MAARRPRVLAIDAGELTGAALARGIGRDCELRVVTRGLEALARFAAGDRYDAILYDPMLPDVAGIRFREELRRIAPGQARRVVFLAGPAITDGARRFLARLSNRILEKPLHSSAVRAAIGRCDGDSP